MSRLLEQASDYDVYTGLWTNHARGSVYGATLTLNRQAGAVLIAFLALYVGLAGSGCWNIVRFLLHRVFSSSSNPDGLYHQRQVILRNSGSAHSGAWELFQVSLAWRGSRARRNTVRLAPIIGLSAVLSLAFTAAGILSSHVTSTSAREVLLTGRQCGALVPEFDATAAGASGYAKAQLNIYRSKKYTEYLTYALQCYGTDARSEKCRTYVKGILPYTKQGSGACPFDQALCKSNSSNLVLDTGYLMSDTDLGINGGPKFHLRQLRHCAPLATEGFKQNTTSEGKDVIQYHYQGVENATGLQPDIQGDDSFTWQVPLYNITEEGRLGNSERQSLVGYKYGVVSERPNIVNSKPLLLSRSFPEAQRSVLFLEASGILYPAVGEPNRDPWFAASMPLNQYLGSDEDNEFYLADEPASPVGCATQTYICNPRLPAGSDCVTSFKELLLRESLAKLWTNDNERVQVQGALRFLAAAEVFDADMFYELPGLPTLQTQYSIDGPVQADRIPDNRWQTEMEFIFQASLASLQAALVETATGDLLWERGSDYNSDGDTIPGCAPEAACRAVCSRQMIRSPGDYSFSVLGVSIVLCLGGVFIIFGFFIENVAYAIDWLRTRGNRDTSAITYAQAEWNSSSPLQLQRLANEALGLGAWSGAHGAIPVTERGDVLGVLDVRDKKHPRLMHPQSFDGEVLKDHAQDVEKQPAATARPVMARGDSWVGSEPSDRDRFLAKKEDTNGTTVGIGRAV